uniref:Uncharacterized protein n=1 Tax=Arundo donax TaxID=35708 RepID=A0A0A9D4F7_ARUDO
MRARTRGVRSSNGHSDAAATCCRAADPEAVNIVYAMEAEPVAEVVVEETPAQDPANPGPAQGDMSFPVFPVVGEPFQGQVQPLAGWTVVWEPASP